MILKPQQRHSVWLYPLVLAMGFGALACAPHTTNDSQLSAHAQSIQSWPHWIRVDQNVQRYTLDNARGVFIPSDTPITQTLAPYLSQTEFVLPYERINTVTANAGEDFLHVMGPEGYGTFFIKRGDAPDVLDPTADERVPFHIPMFQPIPVDIFHKCPDLWIQDKQRLVPEEHKSSALSWAGDLNGYALVRDPQASGLSLRAKPCIQPSLRHVLQHIVQYAKVMSQQEIAEFVGYLQTVPTDPRFPLLTANFYEEYKQSGVAIEVYMRRALPPLELMSEHELPSVYQFLERYLITRSAAPMPRVFSHMDMQHIEALMSRFEFITAQFEKLLIAWTESLGPESPATNIVGNAYRFAGLCAYDLGEEVIQRRLHSVDSNLATVLSTILADISPSKSQLVIVSETIAFALMLRLEKRWGVGKAQVYHFFHLADDELVRVLADGTEEIPTEETLLALGLPQATWQIALDFAQQLADAAGEISRDKLDASSVRVDLYTDLALSMQQDDLSRAVIIAAALHANPGIDFSEVREGVLIAEQVTDQFYENFLAWCTYHEVDAPDPEVGEFEQQIRKPIATWKFVTHGGLRPVPLH